MWLSTFAAQALSRTLYFVKWVCTIIIEDAQIVKSKTFFTIVVIVCWQGWTTCENDHMVSDIWDNNNEDYDDDDDDDDDDDEADDDDDDDNECDHT